ncbi:hypothetical protein [Streptomyces sp. SAJ15]|uniref:hypothetical protein n=1 Tax=Streptomyces sp. SAJ15 TaxID=2011095 RepID=UPI001184CCD6|nr:hypothetical protein [Streptomyces sp. SAJ15]
MPQGATPRGRGRPAWRIWRRATGDVFGLLPVDLPGTEPLLELLGELPRHAMVLGHGVEANTDFLQQIAALPG